MPRTNSKKVPESGITCPESGNPNPESGDNTIKFPPEGTYTGVLIAEEFGIKEWTLRDWYKELCEGIYQVCPEILKKGQLYTQTAYDEFFLMRQHRYKNRMLINSRGQIVRLGDGQPAIEKCQRMSKTDYQTMRWEQKPEFVPGNASDSVEAHIEEGGAIEAIQIYDAEIIAKSNSAQENIDNIAALVQGMEQEDEEIATLLADTRLARISELLTKKVFDGLKDVNGNLGKAMKARQSK